MFNSSKVRRSKGDEADDLIYLDYHSTTPCDPRVVEAVASCLNDTYGNPSSPHGAGGSAKSTLKQARKTIACHIGARPGEVVFTGGATESNNISIIGLVKGTINNEDGRERILTSSVEHKSVLKPAKAVSEYGFQHSSIPVDRAGQVDPAVVSELVDDRTLLVSVQVANNEIGAIQPIHDIAKHVHEAGAYLHCDAAQTLGRVNVDVKNWGADLVSFSAHKAYGPKGIGLLYIKGGPANIPVEAIEYGGGQESGLRPGTVNVPGAVGFSEACRIIDENGEDEKRRLKKLRDALEDKIISRIEGARVVGPRNGRLVSTTNIRFAGVEAEALLARAQGVAISTGSACESGAPEPSHVLQAIGFERQEAYECVRFAVGRFTTVEDVNRAVDIICEAVGSIRQVLAS